MTKEELEEIIAFLNSLVKGYDEINNRITYFAGYLLGKSVAQSSRDSDVNSEESTMKYQKVQIKRRKDGRWYARYTLAPCKYHDIYGRTQAECYDKLKAFADNKRLVAQKIKQLSVPASTLTFGAFFHTWLKEEKVPTCKPSTIHFYEIMHKNHLSQFDDREIKKISADELRAAILAIPSSKIRKTTYQMFSDIFRTALRRDLIAVNPMDKISAPKHKTEERHAFTREEEKRFVALAKNYDCAVIFWLMLYEGLRTSEAKALAPCDIHEDYIEVRHSIDDLGNLIPTKTNKIRRVPIFSEFKEFADRYRGSSETPILGKVNKHTAVREYAEICKAAGITKNMYCLRHTFATRCEEARISSKQTALWMGHSSINTTLSYYININKEFELENVAIKNGLHKS